MTVQTHQEWLDGENDPASVAEEIKKIIKSNSLRNRYTKNTWCKVENEELTRLNELISRLD